MSKRLASYLLQLKQNLKPVPVSQTGMWFQDKDVIVPSNRITMKGPDGSEDYFKEPIIGQGVQSGEVKVMQPGKEYHFPNDKQVFEKRMQGGGEMLLDLASYVPGPTGIYASGVGLVNDAVQGDLWGVGLNTANILTGGAAKGAMSLARYAANAGARNTARGLATASHTLNRASRTANNVTQPIDKARTISSTGTYLNTQRTPQRESTYVAPRPRPIMQGGGETEIEEDDDREMVEGIADILRQVKDKDNRKQIAKKMVEDFEEEDVDYNLDNFLEASRVMQMGGMSIPGVNGTVIASTPSLYKKYKSGGNHGGLDRWFAEKWVDVKSGKPCGRQEGENRAYPACRPSRRISSKTPKTSSEMSSQEKARFKSTKTSSQRIPYNHKRK